MEARPAAAMVSSRRVLEWLDVARKRDDARQLLECWLIGARRLPRNLCTCARFRNVGWNRASTARLRAGLHTAEVLRLSRQSSA